MEQDLDDDLLVAAFEGQMWTRACGTGFFHTGKMRILCLSSCDSDAMLVFRAAWFGPSLDKWLACAKGAFPGSDDKWAMEELCCLAAMAAKAAPAFSSASFADSGGVFSCCLPRQGAKEAESALELAVGVVSSVIGQPSVSFDERPAHVSENPACALLSTARRCCLAMLDSSVEPVLSSAESRDEKSI